MKCQHNLVKEARRGCADYALVSLHGNDVPWWIDDQHVPGPWTGAFWWLCLDHYQSRATGYRPHSRVGSSWVPAQEMRGGRVHAYFPAPGMADQYRTSPNEGFHAPETELS